MKTQWMAIALGVLGMSTAQAGYFEYSIGLSYNRSNYAGESYSWSRRWGTSLGYNFSDQSQVEFAFQDVTDRNHFVHVEDSTYHDRIYSLNWVQNLMSKKDIFQPYFKLGIGQLNREAEVTDSIGRTQASIVDSVTGVVGAGARIYFTQQFAIRTEATSYLSGGRLSTWKDNIAVTIGASVFF